MKWDEYKTIFNDTLEQYIDSKISEVGHLFYDDILQNIINYIQVFQQWGKRIRPYMVYALYKAFDWKWEDILQLSMTPELVHLFALVHDDIIDKWTIRHDNPTVHKYIESQYDNAHIWMWQAILIWDLIYTWAQQNVHKNTDNNEAKTFVSTLLQEVIIGEMIDVHMSVTPLVDDPEKILRKDKLKSWYYTFTRPMMLWAMLANVDHDTMKKVENLWSTIALAFQMRDDLMDVIETDSNKTPFSDLKEWNQTILFHETFKRISQEDKVFILSYRWKDFGSDIQEKIITIINNSWAIEETKNKINDYLQAANKQLDTLLNDDNIMKESIREVITFLKV